MDEVIYYLIKERRLGKKDGGRYYLYTDGACIYYVLPKGFILQQCNMSRDGYEHNRRKNKDPRETVLADPYF